MMKRLSYMTSNDRTVIVIAVAAIAAGLALLLYTGRGSESLTVAPQDSTLTDSVRLMLRHKSAASAYYDVGGRTAPELFPFDPNTADSTQLLRLGLQSWQVRAIYKYRNKGQVYCDKEDFSLVPGLTKGQFRRLEPYIRIGDDYKPAREIFAAARQDRHFGDTLQRPYKLGQGETVDINTADTLLLRRVPGIGEYFSRRITGYRDRLGGYYSVQQLLEITDFPAESLPYLTVSAAQLRLINVNTASFQQLRRHPYIGFNLARTITEHRRLHGRIASLDDLKLYRDFTPEVIARLQHYVSF